MLGGKAVPHPNGQGHGIFRFRRASRRPANLGRGFSTEHITKVGAYMQFDRKLHEQQGLGLGLTIVRRLTELHGGTLTIQKGSGGGTLVTIKLPKVDSSESGAGALDGPGMTASHQTA